MRFRVLGPDGKAHEVAPTMEVWQDKPAPPAGAQRLGVRSLRLRVEPTDPRGRYIVQAQVKDDVADDVLLLQKAFTAVGGP